MPYQIRIPPPVEAEIAHIHPLIKRRIKAALDDLSREPSLGKPLKEDLAGSHSYRVNRYRIVYEIRPRQMEIRIVAIGHRGAIYQSIKT